MKLYLISVWLSRFFFAHEKVSVFLSRGKEKRKAERERERERERETVSLTQTLSLFLFHFLLLINFLLLSSLSLTRNRFFSLNATSRPYTRRSSWINLIRRAKEAAWNFIRTKMSFARDIIKFIIPFAVKPRNAFLFEKRIRYQFHDPWLFRVGEHQLIRLKYMRMYKLPFVQEPHKGPKQRHFIFTRHYYFDELPFISAPVYYSLGVTVKYSWVSVDQWYITKNTKEIGVKRRERELWKFSNSWNFKCWK